jgi:hypothetical protein
MTAEGLEAMPLWRAEGTAVDGGDATAVEGLYQATGRLAVSKTERLVGRWEDRANSAVDDVKVRRADG